LRFDPSGALFSAQSVGAALWPAPPSGEHSVDLKGIAPAPSGGVLVLAEVADPVDDSLALLRLDAAGDLVWILRLGANSGQADASLAADGSGNALVAAQGNGESSFDVGCGTVSPGGTSLVYVGADGTPRWSRSWDAGDSLGFAGFDAAGDALLFGRYYESVDLGGGPLPAPAGPIQRAVVLKLSPSGVHMASRTFGDGTDDPAVDIIAGAVTPDGALCFVGAYS